MKLAVLGAGGVGGYFGARLSEAGQEVTLLARGAHKAAIERQGLQIRSELGDVTAEQLSVSDDIASVAEADVVLVCVKLWDTESLASAMAPFLKPDALVLSLQNGVEAEDILESHLGPEPVAGAVTYIFSQIAEPGVIRHIGALARIVVGVRHPGQEPALARFVFACHHAGIDLTLSPDIDAEIWRKFVFLTAVAGTTCFYRAAVGEIREDPDRRALFADLVAEAAAVGRGRGVTLAESLEESALSFLDELAPEMKSSMLLDLERGNRLELEWLTGAVRRLGEEVGVETPRSDEVYEALKSHAD